jgi:replicative DNA helicase
MTKIALNAKFEPEERLMKMKNMLDSISISDANPDECHISKFLDEIVADIISGKLPETVSTGIYDLDELLAGGFSKGDFVLIAGDTRNYKSTLMYNICLNVAMQGKPVIIFSYENTKKEIIEILISMLALLNSRILKSRKIHNTSIKDDEQIIAKIEKAKQQLLKLPVFIVDSDVDLTDIKLLSLTHKVELVAIDYIQIMPETKKMGKTEAVGRISRDLKMFTKPDALNCPVIGLSQFSKIDKSAGPRRRTLNDLKDSSCLEQDPNIILFTEKHETRTHNGKINKINIRVMKNRNGEEGELSLDVNPMYHMIYGSQPCVK